MTTDLSAPIIAAPSLDERLSARRTSLSPTEQRVADFFARHREDVAFFSALEIAQRLGMSDATVVRTAQSLGYAGLQELKQEFVRALRARTTPARAPSRLEEIDDHPEAALDHALTAQIDLLEEARRTVRPEAFAQALDILHAADRILIFGTGPSASLADHLALRLVRIGRQAATVSGTGLGLADTLLMMRPGDVLIAMAYHRVYREAEVTLNQAKERGLPVVLLTDTLGMALAEHVTVTLSARRSRYGLLGSVATTLVLMDALVIGLTARDRARAVMAVSELNDLRSRIVGYRVDTEWIDTTTPTTEREDGRAAPEAANGRARKGAQP
ncbi:MAG TPA: MurR/RpiR family transcriptional regulator [Thermomicrobiales bacterium]